jgi:LysM repeat protein
MEDIIRANGIDDASAIYVEQKFDIPGCKGGKHTGYAGERRADTTVHPGSEDRYAYPQRREVTYVVQPGDMLSWIAEAYNVNTYELAAYNGIDNLNFIYTGQVLAIPN